MLLLLIMMLAQGAYADDGATVTAAHARFTVITPELIRMEYSPGDAFVDEPSLFAANRSAHFDGAKIATATDGTLTIDTGAMKLAYRPDGKPFGAANLAVSLHDANGAAVTWTPGLANARNLGGTLNSLDHVTGSVTPLDATLADHAGQWTVAQDAQGWAKRLTLTPGVLARDGWFLLDDSARLLVGADGWAQERAANSRGAGSRAANSEDWYFFGYGSDYKGALRSLTAIGGTVPLPRRYTLGSWYSRFWPYSADDYRTIIQEFAQHQFPLDMVVLDMDWHKGTDPATGQAYYTGYSWNTQLFPDPGAFLGEVHTDGLHVTLNDHPGDGVRSAEDRYADFARAIGQDPATGKPYAFDGSSPAYIAAFFDFMHDPTEKLGADFWWVDWMGDWDKPFNHMDWVNELYFRHSMEDGRRRGQGFSRWADWGDHRHPLHFSGDIDIEWSALALEVPFTATAGNVGAFFWTHDIGGFAGTRNPELFARWAQFGAFSAALRLHSTRDATLDKRPWTYTSDIEDSLRASFHLRDELFPYTYSMAWRAHADSLPLLRPLYLEYPSLDDAYRNPQEYLYGDAFLVAPVTNPIASMTPETVWIPPGRWYGWFSGEAIDGPATRKFRDGLDTFPLFVRGGVPVPMQPYRDRMAADAVSALRIALFPGDAGETTLYEDDGESVAYETGAAQLTHIAQTPGAKRLTIAIAPDTGKYDGRPATRDYVLELHGYPTVAGVTARADGVSIPAGNVTLTPGTPTYVKIAGMKVEQKINVQVTFP